MLRSCPYREENAINIHNIKEATIVDDVERNIPKVYVALKGYQADHQLDVVEVECKISKQSFSILIDMRSSHNSVTS